MTLPTPQVRPLTADDAAAYQAVRLSVLSSDPRAYVTTAQEFADRTLESVAKQLGNPDSITFGAFVDGKTVDGKLVGILGLIRQTRPTIRHRADIVGVGVLEEARGQGCGAALLAAAIAQAHAWEGVSVVNLAVTETQHAARRLYERHGFVCWGVQSDAVRHEGQSYSEYWLSLSLGE